MNRVLLVHLCLSSLALAQDARQIMSEVQSRSQSKSQHYEGTLTVTDSRKRIAEKRWEYNRLGSHGDSKAMLRFTAPSEVKGVALLILNHPDRASDQWMWIPANARERRIALQDRSTRFFGTDFSFEDLEERDVDQYDYKLLGEDPVDGAACWKIESRPKQGKSSQYTSSLLWVRKDNYAIARVESYSKEKIVRRLQYSDIQKVQGVWSARKLEMFDVGRNSRTTMILDKLQYNVPLKEEDFTLQALRRQS
ncbi:MAG TPA: outer membrane lipoprotein-sorting protein [Bryobacteraceae bacterium]|nr:outer membrane lipoprotein-sorting protein [Bryobacteraceae bacterium]